MESEVIDEILITIVKEFTQPKNFQRIIDEQILANAIFYSFAVGVLKNADGNEIESIEDLKYVQQWIEEKQDILMGFTVSDDNE